jgi:hypothetical protein
MKDIYITMANQNILKFYGSKLDLKLDNSEFYDFEIAKTEGDYDINLLDLSSEIIYTGLTINGSLSDFSGERSTITLCEIDNTINDSDYIFSGLTYVIDYNELISEFDSKFEHTILNNNVFTYTGITDETHYFEICSFNEVITNTFTGFTNTIIECKEKLNDTVNYCSQASSLNNKPWAYKTDSGAGDDNSIEIIKRRPENGWTLDFIFSRESLPWSFGGKFYYFGVRGDSDLSDYADNNLSFGFTEDGRIEWTAVRYSGSCDTISGYTETYYTETGQTEILCTTGDTKDFNVTIVFDRYNHYTGCDLDNKGGKNDLIQGPHAMEYTDLSVSAVTSTQIATGYLITNTYDVITSGSTETYDYTEKLNKNWENEQNFRLGDLKIYLNGKLIYKLTNWEEVISSSRGEQPFIQSWGGGTGLMNNSHNGICEFNIKSIKYYQEPLNMINVKHNFLSRLQSYDFDICGLECMDELDLFILNGLLTEAGEYIKAENGDIIIY